ncbi:MAG: helix-turn-helix domain-containing protein, partial [Gammaproteobacteria bacterium]
MLGIWTAWDVNVAPVQAIVRGAGRALRMDVRTFEYRLQRSPAFGRELKRYAYCLMSQLAQMAVCARYHLIEARLARMILMISDGAHSDELPVTQEFIASLLAVRRVSITTAARSLQKRQLISYHRGALSILNRPGLEEASCSCYLEGHETHGRIMGNRILSARGAWQK